MIQSLLPFHIMLCLKYFGPSLASLLKKDLFLILECQENPWFIQTPSKYWTVLSSVQNRMGYDISCHFWS